VSIERVFACDAPGCKGHIRTAAARPFGLILVTDTSGLAARRTLHFCSWDCVLRFASEQPPVETAELSDPPWGDRRDQA